jgi:hypothetical protein
MKLSPSTEANSSSATQEIPRRLWKTNVHYNAHNSSLLALILRQHIPVFTSPSHHSKAYFPFVLSSTPKISNFSVSFKFGQQSLFSPPVAKLHPCHPLWFANPHDI